MRRHFSPATPDTGTTEDERGARVVVLVDGSPATAAALRRAVRLADRRGALLTISAYAPGALIEGDMAARQLTEALIVAQAEAELEGVAAERHLLHGPDPLAQLRDLFAPPPSPDLLVLCSPTMVVGPLRALVRTLLRDPPCTVHLVAPSRGLRARLVGWLARASAAS